MNTMIPDGTDSTKIATLLRCNDEERALLESLTADELAECLDGARQTARAIVDQLRAARTPGREA